MIRVLVADDHAVVRAGLRLLIDGEEDMRVVGEASNPRGAVRSARKGRPNVIIMDVSFPEGSGIPAASEVLEASPDSSVLVLTMHADPAYVRAALAAGASGYVVKRSADTELLAAIRAVAKGGTYIDRSLSGRGPLTSAPASARRRKRSEPSRR